MTRFLVKASEFKNVCKAVNDRKLAELKKEIIEILKKQDEKEVKKAVDYFNSQELHYTHLEKSLSGKWIQKAGYGIGTVRIWKGKKYKKIAPGKWARVFEKEGRGTNIAIGKLIARVQKIDNVEDLMAFVMQNKQRFVDENGVDLPVLDKLRAAVGVKNENLSGESSSYTYGVGENVSREKNKIFEGKEKITKEEADLHKVSRKFEQIPTTELKQRKAKLERWIENKTRSKRDSLNNAIYRESYQKELDAINAVLDKRNGKKETSKPAEKVGEGKVLDYKNNPSFDKYKNMSDSDLNTAIKNLTSRVEDMKQQIDDNSSNENIPLGIASVKAQNNLLATLKQIQKDKKEEKSAEKKEDLEAALKEVEDAIDNAGDYDDVEELEKERKQLLKKLGKKPVEKKKTFKQEMNELYDAQDKAWEGFESGSEIKASPENSKKFYERVKKFVDENNIKLSKKHYDEIADGNGHSFNEALALAGAYGEENKKRALAKNRENAEKYKGAVLDLSMINEFKEKEEESEAEKTQNRSDAMKGNKNAYKGRVEDIQLKNGARLTSRDGNTYSFAKTSPDRKTSLFTEVKQDKRDGSFSVDYYTADSNGRIKYDAGEEGLETDFEDMNSLEEGLNKFFERNPKTESEKSSKEIKSKTDKTVQKIDSDSFTKIDNKTIEMPADKTTRSIFETLNKSRSIDKARAFMTDCYYDGENIVSTDGKRLTVIKAENLDLEPGYVNVKTDGGKVTLERIEGKEEEYKFPIYQRVIPQNNNQEVKLNNKVLRDKLKQLKKEGAYNNSYGSFNRVTLEFEDGKVLLDGTVVGTGNVKDNQDLNYRNFNGDYLLEALSDSDTTSMFLDEESMHPITIRTNISDTVIMPMTNDNKADYETGREAKRKSNDEKAAKLSKNREANERLISNNFKNIDGQVERVYSNIDKKISEFSDEELKRNYDILNLNFDKIMDRSIDFVSDIVNKKTNASFATTYSYSELLKKYPDVKDKFLAEFEKRGISVKKSLFDDLFEIDIIEDDEIEEEDFEDNPLFNDYSAEQPELFNSTELMVSEAFNRCNCL